MRPLRFTQFLRPARLWTIDIITPVAAQLIRMTDFAIRTRKAIGTPGSAGARSDRIAGTIFETVEVLSAISGFIATAGLTIADLSTRAWRNGARLLAGTAYTDSRTDTVDVTAVLSVTTLVNFFVTALQTRANNARTAGHTPAIGTRFTIGTISNPIALTRRDTFSRIIANTAPGAVTITDTLRLIGPDARCQIATPSILAGIILSARRRLNTLT